MDGVRRIRGRKISFDRTKEKDLPALQSLPSIFEDEDFVAHLWEAMNHPTTLANLPLIGKSYGAGAVKVEPRALERLPIAEHLVEKLGLPRKAGLF